MEKIDKSVLITYDMIKTRFLNQNKLEKIQFYEKSCWLILV